MTEQDATVKGRAVAGVLAPAGEPVHGPLIVTGTDTGVGKTITTAAIAAAAATAGLRVAVIKPGQTGIPDGLPPEVAGEESDVDTIVRLAGPASARTLASYPDPLAPLTAARVSGLPALGLAQVVDAVRADARRHDLVLVEGAGGLLVPMGAPTPEHPASGGWTVADLALALDAPAVVVARADLGTLNHTALTREACERRGITTGVVIGSWPNEPELVHLTNLMDLVGELAGVLPAAASTLPPAVFRSSAPTWLAPVLYGRFDPRAFRSAAR